MLCNCYSCSVVRREGRNGSGRKVKFLLFDVGEKLKEKKIGRMLLFPAKSHSTSGGNVDGMTYVFPTRT